MKNIKSLSMLVLGASVVATINTASADVQHLDDVIIGFSLCTGNDCVNGENFGFDTMRLKENNLRIHFDDTSTSASFPSNDWRIKINDTGNGGANYFAIEDSTAGRVPFRVDAGAPVDALRVDSAGDVGIGVSNPLVDLHVKSGNTATLRLEQDGSSGFTPQTYDIGSNESNFFIRDVTNGSSLFFRAQPSAPADSIFIANDGNIGLGTSAPKAPLHIRNSGAPFASSFADLLVQDSANTTDIGMISIISGDTANSQLTFGNSTNQFLGQIIYNANTSAMNFNVAGVQRLSISNDGSLTSSTGASLTSGGAWTDASSRELKNNIASISVESAIDTVMSLTPVSFNYKKNPSEDHMGFIAEEVPEQVAYNDRARLSSMDIVAVLTRVVQQQQETIAELQATVDKIIAD